MNIDQKSVNKVALASVIGATIEWYDFFLYGVVAGLVLNKLYFPGDDPAMATLMAYATFAVGFISRPLGGIIFGHFGDKIGRKKMLVVTLMIMGISTVAIGLVPTYAQIGVAAPLLLIFLRIIQGIGLGGEWGGAILMAYEYAPPHRRGFYASLPQIGLSLGVLLSAIVIAALNYFLTEEQFMQWGWRSAFVLSFVMILFGLWVRLSVMETPAFAQMKKEHGEAKVPFLDMIKRFPGNVLLGLGARHVDGVVFNIFAVFSISYLTDKIHLSRADALIGVMIASAVLTVFIPVFGWASDKVNRFRFYALASIITALSCYPAFWVMNQSEGNLWMIWLAVSIPFGVIYASVYGPISGFLCELFDARVRYTGISFVYQLSSVFAGGLTPIIATLLLTANGGSPWMICAYVLGCGVLSSICSLIIARRFRLAKATSSPAQADAQAAPATNAPATSNYVS